MRPEDILWLEGSILIVGIVFFGLRTMVRYVQRERKLSDELYDLINK